MTNKVNALRQDEIDRILERVHDGEISPVMGISDLCLKCGWQFTRAWDAVMDVTAEKAG